MFVAATVGVTCVWLYGLGGLACAASGLRVLTARRGDRKARLFCLGRGQSGSGPQATQEAILRLVGGLAAAVISLAFAVQASLDLHVLLRAG